MSLRKCAVIFKNGTLKFLNACLFKKIEPTCICLTYSYFHCLSAGGWLIHAYIRSNMTANFSKKTYISEVYLVLSTIDPELNMEEVKKHDRASTNSPKCIQDPLRQQENDGAETKEGRSIAASCRSSVNDKMLRENKKGSQKCSAGTHK